MTQQQLGEAIGIEGKGAANRIAQYECDYRISQNDMLIDMEKAMDITPLLFVSPIPSSTEDIMQTFSGWMKITETQSTFSLLSAQTKETKLICHRKPLIMM